MVRQHLVAAVFVTCGLGIVCRVASRASETPSRTETESRPQMLSLHTEFLPYEKEVDKGIAYRLGREIVRQAILLAARDELGLATCDETLKETEPKNAQVVHVMPMERADLRGKWNVKLIPYAAADQAWEKTYDYAANGSLMYADMIPKLEADSRAVRDALRASGLQGDKPQSQESQPPGEEIEQLLRQVDFIAQYGAVRAAHQAISAHGETPEWLGVLVRGYANLTLLTNHHWTSATEVFTARSWLYAQRMVASSPDRNSALWHRAYAWALGGALHHALTDLEELQQPQQEVEISQDTANVNKAEPSWSELIKPYCMFDRVALKEVGEHRDALQPWALRLQFELASSYGISRWMYDLAEEITQVDPTAYGVYADLVMYGRLLGLKRSGAAWGPLMFGRFVPENLGKLPYVPEATRQLMAENAPKSGGFSGWFGDRDSSEMFSPLPMSLARQLRQETEEGVPTDLSWSALAYLLEEEQFVQIVHHFVNASDATEHSMAAGMAIVGLFRTGDASQERLERIDSLLCELDPTTRGAYAYYVGKELDRLGKTAEADRYWRRSLVIPGGDTPGATLSGWELAKRHSVSRPDDDALDETDLWPPPQAEELDK